MKILITVLLLSLSSFAQTLTITDDSPSDSPIQIKGAVTYDSAGKTTCTTLLHNSAPKIVVAWRQDIEASFPNGGYQLVYFRHDHFFKDEVASMSPQASSDAESYIPCQVFSTSLGPYGKVPGIHVKTYWVQFLDGSVWGDSDAQAYMMAERTNAIVFLNQLKAAYATGGDKAFTQTLAGFTARGATSRATDEHNEANNVQIDLMQMADVPTQLAEVYRRLALATSHANWMK